MTRKEIRDMARKRLGEITGAFWTDAELNGWIDDSGVDIAFKSKSIRTNGYMTSLVNTSDYSVMAAFPNLIAVTDVYFKVGGTTWRRLRSMNSREQLDEEFPGWLNTPAGIPEAYYWSREEDLLLLFPKPNAANAGTDFVRVFYARTYTPLSTDTQSPTLPSVLHFAMVDWVVSLGYETRGYGDKSNDAMGKCERRIHSYLVESKREKEDDEIIMRNYRG